jgi:hypothetical protein
MEILGGSIEGYFMQEDSLGITLIVLDVGEGQR